DGTLTQRGSGREPPSTTGSPLGEKSPTSPIRPHRNTCQTYGQPGVRRPSARRADRRLRIGPSRYLDLTRLRLLGNRDAQGEYALIVGGRDPVSIQAFAEEQLAGEGSLGPLCNDDVLSLRRAPFAFCPYSLKLEGNPGL